MIRALVNQGAQVVAAQSDRLAGGRQIRLLAQIHSTALNGFRHQIQMATDEEKGLDSRLKEMVTVARRNAARLSRALETVEEDEDPSELVEKFFGDGDRLRGPDGRACRSGEDEHGHQP